MQGKTIVVVEDEDAQREPLVNALARRGFHAVGAATAAEARRVIGELGEKTDVLVLDVVLEDADEPDTTGPDIAIESSARHPHWMPEHLFLTVHDKDANNYKLAMRLGAAALLGKDSVGLDGVVQHIRALALKRALRVERARVVERLSSISESSKSLSHAVGKFCREMLADELDACLGVPYVLLLTDERGTRNAATNTYLPLGYGAPYAAAQIMAHGINSISPPYVISEHDLKGLPAPANEAERQVLDRLAGTSLVPLAGLKNFRLSLALLLPRPGEVKYDEDSRLLASLLTQYVRPAVVEHFLGILIHLSTQKRARLKSISDLFLSLGQDQQRVIDEGVDAQDLRAESDTHHKLAAMADDLWRTGAILSSAWSRPLTDAAPSFEMSELIQSVSFDSRQSPPAGGLDFAIEGTCHVRAIREEMRVVVKRLLQWLVHRGAETPLGARPRVHVRCAELEDGPLIVFEDGSRRLPAELRARLFEPFATLVPATTGVGEGGPGLSLPLYLAKVLVEEKYGGSLEDATDEMDGEVGHRLVMRFGPARADPESPGPGAAF